MNWSLATNLGSVTKDSLDRYFQSWQVAWIGHVMRTDPGSIMDSNTFWPLKDSLVFSDVLFGYAPVGMIGSGPDAAMVRYNVLSLVASALAFFGAALLARELGLSWPASVVAGAAFGFAPWRLAHHNHLHVLSSGGIPAALFLMLRGYRRSSARLVLGGWVVATWQVTLGFTLGVQFGYLLGILGAMWAVRWLRAGRPRPAHGLVLASAGGMALFLVVSVVLALPFLKILKEHPESRRPPELVALYSPPPAGFLAAPDNNILWGGVTSVVRNELGWAPEMTLFPGLTVMILAVAGLALPVLSKRLRLGLGAAVVVSGVLAMGYSFAGGRAYDLMYRLAPGWQSSRTPGRLFTITSLGLALLGAAGAGGLVNLLRRGSFGGDARRLLVLPAVLTVAILAEGVGRVDLASLPESPLVFGSEADPQIHLPTDFTIDPLYMLWSTDGFPRIFNGYAGFNPASQQTFREQIQLFPDPGSVRMLREAGFKTLVLHRDLAPGTPWADADERVIDGLGITRVFAKGVTIYRF